MINEGLIYNKYKKFDKIKAIKEITKRTNLIDHHILSSNDQGYIRRSQENNIFKNTIKNMETLQKLNLPQKNTILNENREEYAEYVKSIIEKYEIGSIFRGNKTENQKEDISKLVSKGLFSTFNNIYNKSNSDIKVKIDRSIFKNSIDSKLVLENNKKLTSEVLSYLVTVQDEKNKKMKNRLDEISKYNQVDQTKVKVTKIAGKSMKIRFNEPMSQNLNASNLDNYQGNDEINISKDKVNVSIITNQNQTQKKEQFQHESSPIENDENKDFAFSIINNCIVGMYHYPLKIFPSGKSEFTFTVNNDNRSLIYLYGGKDACQNNELWTFDLTSMSWSIVLYKNLPAHNQRYGHTTTYYNNKLYIFGGNVRSMGYYYIPDFEVFNIEDSTWSIMNFSSKSYLKLRKYHIAELVGPYIIIHGGITEENEYLNDTYIFHIPSNKWIQPSFKVLSQSNPNETKEIINFEPKKLNFKVSSLDIKNMNMNEKENKQVQPPTLAFHSSCVVLPEEIISSSKTNVFKFPDLNKRGYNKAKEKGIYVFGGKHSSSSEDISKELYVLRIGHKLFEWVKIETEGKPPLDRYLCSLTYIDTQNMLFIHGGKNDSIAYNYQSKLESQENKENKLKTILKDESIEEDIFDTGSIKKTESEEEDLSSTLNDTYVIDLNKLIWIRIEVISTLIKDFSVSNRFGHSVCKAGETLFIFGGMNEHSYVGSSFLAVNLSKLLYFYYINLLEFIPKSAIFEKTKHKKKKTSDLDELNINIFNNNKKKINKNK